MDIFENSILCKQCKKVMKPVLISKNGFNLRTIRCEKCNEIIVHPADKAEYDEFMRLKNKEFEEALYKDTPVNTDLPDELKCLSSVSYNYLFNFMSG